MTTLFWALLIMAISMTIMAITLTVSEIQTIWIKYKRSKAQQEMHAIDPLPILRAIKEEEDNAKR